MKNSLNEFLTGTRVLYECKNILVNILRYFLRVDKGKKLQTIQIDKIYFKRSLQMSNTKKSFLKNFIKAFRKF